MIRLPLSLRVGLVALCIATSARAISFIRPNISTTVPMPGFMVAGDVNNDGRADLAVSSPQSSKVAVLLGTVDGTLTINTTYDVGKQLADLAIGKVDGDNFPDIAVADQRGPGIHILLGIGNGTFATPQLVEIGRTPGSVAIVDLDGANGGDLVVADKGNDRVLILLNSGRTPLAFTPGGEYPTGQGPVGILLSDFNGDATADIATLNTGGTRVKDISMFLFERIANGLPVYGFLANFVASENPSFLTAGDFNGDHHQDAAMLNLPGGRSNGSIDLRVGRGDGFLSSGPSLALPCPVFTNDLTCRGRAFASADFDADGILDLAVTQLDPRAATAQDWLALFRGNGDGTFATGPVLGTDPVASLITVGDVTGDGAVDVIVGSDRARTVQVFINATTGSEGDRLPGQACEAAPQCVTGICSDDVCCRTECKEGERCNLPTRLGTCAIEGEQRPLGERCETREQCESGFCVDHVCCIAGTCPTGARCDIPPTPGVCSNPAPAGAVCERLEHCASGFCVDSVCCADSCPEGRCDAPDHEGTCTGSLLDGETCSANAQCGSGVCDTIGRICCVRRCGENEQCAGDGSACSAQNTPTSTASETPSPSPSPTMGAACTGDCDRSTDVSVNELVTGVNIALERVPVDRCAAFDISGDGRVTVGEIVAGVTAALHGCS